MAEAKRRQSKIARLQAEVDSLRKAGQQLMQGLVEYANRENWRETDDGDYVWINGDECGWETAQKYLGLDDDHSHPPPLDHPNAD